MTAAPEAPRRRRRPSLLERLLALLLLARIVRRRPAAAPPPRPPESRLPQGEPPTETPREPPRPTRLAWGAIFAGALLALATLLVAAAAALGVALGLYEPDEGPFAFEASPLLVLLAFGAAALGCLLLGGWMAGRLSGAPDQLRGALHGLVVWTLVSAVMGAVALAGGLRAADRAAAAGVGLLASAQVGAAALAGSAAVAAGAGAAGAAAGASEAVPLDDVIGEARDLLRQTVTDPEETSEKIARAIAGLGELLVEDVESATTAARPGLVGPPLDEATLLDLIAQQTGAPPERAAQGLDEWRARAGDSVADQAADLTARLVGVVEPVVEAAAQRLGVLLERLTAWAALALLLAAGGLLGMAAAAGLGGALGAAPGGRRR